MRNIFRLLTVFGLLLLPVLFGCGSKNTVRPVVVGASRIGGPELAKVVSGKILAMEEYGEAASLEMREDGTLLAVKSQTEKNDGWWSTEEDRLCLKFKRWGMSRKVCYDVYRKGNEFQMYTDNGLMTSSFTLTGSINGAEPSRESDRGKKSSGSLAAGGSTSGAVSSVPIIQESANSRPAPVSTDSDLRLIYLGMAQNCPGCNLAGVDLSGAQLNRAKLSGTNLKGSKLRRAKLKWADLAGANLNNADLNGADLTGADLSGAQLENADLTGAILKQTKLDGAKTKGSIGFTPQTQKTGKSE